MIQPLAVLSDLSVKNASLPDQMSDRNFSIKKKISSSVTRNPQKMAAALAKQKLA